MQPRCVQRAIEYLTCQRLANGFLSVLCEHGHDKRPVAFSCKWRASCLSCGARRTAEIVALQVNAVLPVVPMRQQVLRLPSANAFLARVN